MISKTMDFYAMQEDFYHPTTVHMPSDLSEAKRVKVARTLNLRSRARNGTAIWTLPVRVAYVTNGSPLTLALSESEFVIAVRKQLGLGFVGIAQRPNVTRSACRCNTKDGVEPTMDLHYAAGCIAGKGHRNRSHKAVLTVVQDTCQQSGLTQVKEKDVSLDLSAPQANRKFMDLVTTDPDSNTTYWIDVTKVNSVAKTVQHRTATSGNGFQKAFELRVKEKARVYGKEANERKAMLVPFVVEGTGAFCPRDPIMNHPDLNVGEALSQIFGGNPPVRGQIPLSAEEGLLQRLARKTARDTDNIFDQTLSEFSASGLLLNQLYQRIAWQSIKGSPRETLTALRRQFCQ